MRSNISVVLGLVCVLVLALPTKEAFAGTKIYWSINSASCIPSNQVIQARTHTIQAGKVQHSGSSVGTVTLYCPVIFPNELPPPATAVNTMWVTTLDTDGQFTEANVDVQLFRAERVSGISASVSTFTSSNFTPTGVWQYIHTIAPFTPNQDGYVYYLRIDLTRTYPAHQAIMYDVILGSVF